MRWKNVCILPLLFITVISEAEVTNTYVGKVMGVRVEGTSGLITMASSMEDGDPSCGRVWVDLLKDEDKAAYSTFLMAFALDSTVHIRANSGANKRYGACDFYDLYIPRQ